MSDDCTLPTIVEDVEAICRYIFSSSHYNSNRAKWGAFEPHNGEVSVFRVDSISEEEKHLIGNNISKQRGQSLKAWVDFTALNVRLLEYPDTTKMKLDVLSEPSPHPRHGNIKDMSKLNNEDWLEEAMILAQKMPMTLKKIKNLNGFL